MIDRPAVRPEAVVPAPPEVPEDRRRQGAQRFLFEAGALLASSLDYEETLARVARLAVPSFADWCSVELVSTEDGIEHVAVAHADPEKVELARELRRRYPPRLDSPHGIANVIRTGTAELHEEISDELLAAVTRDEEHLRIARSLGLRSAMVVPLTARGRTLGTLTFVHAESGRRYTRDDLPLAEELARRAALAVDNARLYAEERRARAEAEEASRRISRVQSVTAALAETLTPEQVVGVIVDEGLAAFTAQAAAVYTLAEGGVSFELLGSVGYPQELQKDGSSFPADLPGPAREAVRSRELVTVESPEELAARWPGLADAQDRTADAAAACAPLVVESRTIGVLYLAFRAPRTFTNAERASISTLARQCAQALERARLYEAERSARGDAERLAHRLRALQTVIDAALAAVSLEELLQDLPARLREVLGTDTATILIAEDEEDVLVVRAALGHERDAAERFRVPVGRGFAGRIAASREPWVAADASTLEILSPELKRRGARALAGVPLVADGRAIGVLHVGSLEPREFSRDDLRLLRLVASRAAVAIERARLHEREHRIAETLQRSLLPARMPDVPGLEVAARYLAGSAGVEVGGDWYDLVTLEDGRVGVVVGDVVGRGIPAAAAMGQLRNALRAFALEGFGPAKSLERLNRLATGPGDDLFATVLYLVLDLRAGTMSLATAGHPPPLLVRPDGSADYLEGGRSLPLGAAPNTGYVEATLELPAGATLLLYTDGLVERRGTALDDGLRELERAALEARGSLDDLLDHVLARLAHGEQQADDIAVVVVRVLEEARSAFAIRVLAEAASLGRVRSGLGDWLAGLGASPDEADEVTLACNEACSNAVEHPVDPREPVIEVEAEVHGDTVSVVVRDSGRWREPDPSGDRGRGLELIAAFMDEVDIPRSERGTEVRMSRRLRRGQPPG